MYRCFSHDKEPVIDLTSSPISKRTRHSSEISNSERFKTPLDSQTFSNIFKDATIVVEHIVRFDTLESTFIPRIFANKDWANLFKNFEDSIDELVKEFYSNARFTGVELKCWVRGKEFIITPNYLAKILCITRLANVDISPYDDRLPLVTDILQILRLKTLTLIMFSILYLLSNTRFINLGRAQFLCDLITRAPINICAHIF